MQYITIPECANESGLSEQYIERQWRDGKLKGSQHPDSGEIAIEKGSLLEFIYEYEMASGDMEAEPDDDGPHDFHCECKICSHERHMGECGRLPSSLGGGCELAGSQHCDFVCPFRDEDE